MTASVFAQGAPASPPETVENLKYTVDSMGGGKGKITLAWENHVASVPVSVH
jgi:hypothetical protein